MLLFKWLGAGMILLMGGYAALAMNRMERRRLDVLDGYISLLRYVKGQINCYAKPVPEILSGADPDLLRVCMGEWRGRQLVGGESFLCLIDAARLYMEPETERLLRNFSAELGQTFRTEQVTRCDDYILALNAEREKLATAAPMRVRVNSVLSLCAAMGIVILLW